MTASVAQRWLRVYRPRPQARVRLVCLPHAGGNATAYRQFLACLDRDVELVSVQYPGRLDRAGDDWPGTMREAATELAAAFTGPRDVPLAIFGHSLGAALAYELARALTEAGDGPDHLIVSGHPPPHRFVSTRQHLLDDDQLWDELRRLGGMPPEFLEHPELRAYALPYIRRDYRFAETYQPVLTSLLDCPITCMSADDDTEVTLEQARAWSEVTTAAFELEVYSGGHFYLYDDPALIAARWVRAVAPQRQGWWR